MKKLAIILLIVGVVLAGVGVAYGAHWGMYADASGFHVMPKSVTEVSQDVDSFNAINVDFGNQSIVVQQGDTYSVDCRYLLAAPNVSVDNGVLKVSSSDSNTWFNIGFWWPNETTTITVPNDVTLDYAQIDNDNGSIDVAGLNVSTDYNVSNHNGSITSRGINVGGNINIKNENGSIYLDTNVCSENMKIQNQNGSINMVDYCKAAQITVGNDNGSIVMNNALGKINVSNHNGGITASIVNLSTDFYVNATTQNGSVSMNGKRSGNAFMQGYPDNGNSFTATNENGSIKLSDLVLQD